jgi:hypothetical protein
MPQTDLAELYGSELEREVKRLFEKQRTTTERGRVRDPVLEAEYFIEDEERSQLLQQRACCALGARRWFRTHRPAWAPDLPISHSEIVKMRQHPSPRMRLVAWFSCSLATNEWNYKIHPPFAVYARGFMENGFTEAAVRNDPELKREYPARPLPGLGDRQPFWRDPVLVAHEQLQQLTLAHERLIAWR